MTEEYTAHLGYGNEIALESIASLRKGKLLSARNYDDDSLINLVITKPENEKSADLSGRFRQRLVRITQINDPNIAPRYIYSIADIEKTNAVFELFQIVSLKDKLKELAEKKAYLPVVDVLSLIRQLTEALAAAYWSGIVHPNLTPASIFIKEDNSLALIDIEFTHISPLTIQGGNGHSVNLLGYAAPEHLQRKELSGQSIIYTLGIILYELLAGNRPAIHTVPWDIFDEEHDELPRGVSMEETREGLSPETYRLVRDCLWLEAWNRFEDFSKMIEAIDQAIASEQILVGKPVKPPTKRRWLYPAVAMFLLFLLMGFFLLSRNIGIMPDQPADTKPLTEVPSLRLPQEEISISSGPSTVRPHPTNAPSPTRPLLTATTMTNKIDAVELIAPSPDSEFSGDDRISFEWSWPTNLEQDQEFCVYLYTEGESILIGTVTKPKNGNVYRLLADGDVSVAPGSFNWQVVLEEKPGGGIIAESELAFIKIAPVKTPTATSEQPAIESSIKPPDVTEFTVTPTKVCRPLQPNGWVRYVIKQGDSLSRLATQSDITVDEIQQVNCLSGTLIRAGNTLWLPPVSVERTIATATPLTNEPPSDSPSKPPSKPPKKPPTPTPPRPTS